ncbi:MAG: hypothetical protein N2C14_33690, partial [Planctomycetales bacterium]
SQIPRGFPKVTPRWEEEIVDSLAGDQISWLRMRAEGEQIFDKGGVAQAGAYEVHLHQSEHYQVVVATRTPSVIPEAQQLLDANIPLMLGTMQTDPPPTWTPAAGVQLAAAATPVGPMAINLPNGFVPLNSPILTLLTSKLPGTTTLYSTKATLGALTDIGAQPILALSVAPVSGGNPIFLDDMLVKCAGALSDLGAIQPTKSEHGLLNGQRCLKASFSVPIPGKPAGRGIMFFTKANGQSVTFVCVYPSTFAKFKDLEACPLSLIKSQ